MSHLFSVKNLFHSSGAPFTYIFLPQCVFWSVHTVYIPKAGTGERRWFAESSTRVSWLLNRGQTFPSTVCASQSPWSKKKGPGFKMARSRMKECDSIALSLWTQWAEVFVKILLVTIWVRVKLLKIWLFEICLYTQAADKIIQMNLRALWFLVQHTQSACACLELGCRECRAATTELSSGSLLPLTSPGILVKGLNLYGTEALHL